MPNGPEKKLQNRRKAEKYPALKRNLNLKKRRYYIEPDYINGIYDDEGNEIIRPLTDDEKAWLNKFYEEYIIASFKKDGNDLHKTDQERKDIYKENNRRNVCIYNNKLAMALLDQFDSEIYDNISYGTIGHLDFENLLIEQIEPSDDEENR